MIPYASRISVKIPLVSLALYSPIIKTSTHRYTSYTRPLASFSSLTPLAFANILRAC